MKALFLVLALTCLAQSKPVFRYKLEFESLGDFSEDSLAAASQETVTHVAMTLNLTETAKAAVSSLTPISFILSVEGGSPALDEGIKNNVAMIKTFLNNTYNLSLLRLAPLSEKDNPRGIYLGTIVTVVISCTFFAVFIAAFLFIQCRRRKVDYYQSQESALISTAIQESQGDAVAI